MSVDPTRHPGQKCCADHLSPKLAVMNRAERRAMARHMDCKCRGECGWHGPAVKR